MASRATIRTDSWDHVYLYLQTTNAISTNNIFSAMNDTLVSQKGYPIVVITKPTVSFDKLNVTGDLTQSDVGMQIQVYDDNAQDCKALADEVTAKLLAGRATFAGQKLRRLSIENGDSDTWSEGQKKIHRITFDISFVFTSL